MVSGTSKRASVALAVARGGVKGQERAIYHHLTLAALPAHATLNMKCAKYRMSSNVQPTTLVTTVSTTVRPRAPAMATVHATIRENVSAMITGMGLGVMKPKCGFSRGLRAGAQRLGLSKPRFGTQKPARGTASRAPHQVDRSLEAEYLVASTIQAGPTARIQVENAMGVNQYAQQVLAIFGTTSATMLSRSPARPPVNASAHLGG